MADCMNNEPGGIVIGYEDCYVYQDSDKCAVRAYNRRRPYSIQSMNSVLIVQMGSPPSSPSDNCLRIFRNTNGGHESPAEA